MPSQPEGSCSDFRTGYSRRSFVELHGDAASIDEVVERAMKARSPSRFRLPLRAEFAGSASGRRRREKRVASRTVAARGSITPRHSHAPLASALNTQRTSGWSWTTSPAPPGGPSLSPPHAPTVSHNPSSDVGHRVKRLRAGFALVIGAPKRQRRLLAGEPWTSVRIPIPRTKAVARPKRAQEMSSEPATPRVPSHLMP